MNHRNKAYSIILYAIWPFSAVLLGIKNFNLKFGRRLLIAAFVFLGFTASDTGDLERYASQYYEISEYGIEDIIELFLNLQVGKFFTLFSAVLFSGFNDHHIYFGFLFGVYGFFLVNSIDLLRIKNIKHHDFYQIIAFVSFATFYAILTVFNYAFYTGAIYFLYFLLKILLKGNNLKYYLFIFLAPLFHIGLTPLLIVPIFYLVFKRKTIFYILLLITFTSLPRSSFIESFDKYIVRSNNVIQEKYTAYASEEGKKRMDNRYNENYENNNFKYRFFKDVNKLTNVFAIPLLLFILFYNRKNFKFYPKPFNLFNVSIACLAVTHLMLNISQGERFYFISGFMILGAFVYIVQAFEYKNLKIKLPLYFIFPLVLLNNILSYVLIKNFVSIEFIVSNFPLHLFGM